MTGTPRRVPSTATCPSQYAGVEITEMSSCAGTTAVSVSSSPSSGTANDQLAPYAMKVWRDVHVLVCSSVASARWWAPALPTHTALSTSVPLPRLSFVFAYVTSVPSSSCTPVQHHCTSIALIVPPEPRPPSPPNSWSYHPEPDTSIGAVAPSGVTDPTTSIRVIE